MTFALGILDAYIIIFIIFSKEEEEKEKRVRAHRSCVVFFNFSIPELTTKIRKILEYLMVCTGVPGNL